MSLQQSSLPMLDAWVFASALAGQNVSNHVAKVSLPNRQLALDLANAAPPERGTIWEEHLQTLDDENANALIEALADVNPNHSPPEDDGWGEPFAFKLPPVEPFPLDVYPTEVRELVQQGAVAVGCPPDFFAMPILAIAGAAVGRSVSLLLKDDFLVSASIFAINIGLAGDGKSPALSKVVKPLDKLDQEYLEEWHKEMEVYQTLHAEYESASRSSRASAKSATGSARHRRSADANQPIHRGNGSDHATSEVVELEPMKPERPTLRRNVVRDSTTEALDAVMAENQRGLIQVLDEASSLVTSMNQYRGGKGSDRQWYLSTWSGQSRTVDRKMNQDRIPTRVSDPFLSLVGGIVPANVGMLGEGQGRFDGFLDRFLFAYPDPVPKTGWRDEGITSEVAQGWEKVVVRLRSLPMVLREMHAEPHVIRLSPEAKEMWRALIDAHHAEQSGTDFAQSLTGTWSKLEQYAGRTTLILHMLDWAADSTRDTSVIPDVAPATMRKAARLLDYLKSHIRRVHAAMRAKAQGQEGNDDVQCILKWIHRHRPESFSQRDLTRDLSKTFGRRPQSLEEALGWHLKHKCIRLAEGPFPPKGRRGRKPSAVYLVNPHLVSSQNGQNPGLTSASGDPEPDYDDFGISAETEEEVGDDYFGI